MGTTASQVVDEHFQLDAASRKHPGSSFGRWTETEQLRNPIAHKYGFDSFGGLRLTVAPRNRCVASNKRSAFWGFGRSPQTLRTLRGWPRFCPIEWVVR